MDIQYFERLWREGKTSGTSEESYWDNRAEEFNNSVYSSTSDMRVNKIIDFLSINGMLTEESSILDIGCGPGRFAVEFAKRAENVVGIDISERMLDFAVKNAQSKKLTNVSYKKLNWVEADLEDYGWNKKFDLVTAINCPGIKDRNTLEKMMEASRKYCFLSSFVERADSVKDFIVSEILKLGGSKFYNNTIYSIVNILWLSGYYPGIAYFDSDLERERPVEEAYAYYCSSIKTDRGLNDEQKNSIMDYLKKSSENGIVREKVRSKTAWIYWKV